jgi:hypothetical protein
MIGKLNRWYDSLKEPWRFLTAIGLTMPAILLASVDQFPIGIRLVGFLMLFGLLAFRILGIGK